MKQAIVAALIAVALAGCRRSHEGEADPLLGSTNPERGATSDWARPTEPTGPAQPAPESAVTGSPRLYSTPGKVSAVQGDRLVLQADDGKVYSLVVAPNAQIADDPEGIKMSLQQLAPGTQVRASWRDENGQQVAHRIDVVEPLGNPPPEGPSRESR